VPDGGDDTDATTPEAALDQGEIAKTEHLLLDELSDRLDTLK
jgi:hypothetical protein